MLGIIIVGHGAIAEGLIGSSRMIVGEQPYLEGVPLLEGQSPDDYGDEMERVLHRFDACEGILIMADLFGATPFNVAARLAAAGDDIEVVAGVSLPMLLEACLSRASCPLEELAAIAKRAGMEGVKVLSEVLAS